jgi:hypothetical protein
MKGKEKIGICVVDDMVLKTLELNRLKSKDTDKEIEKLSKAFEEIENYTFTHMNIGSDGLTMDGYGKIKKNDEEIINDFKCGEY